MALNKISDNNVTNPLTINTLCVDGTFTSSGTGIFTGGSQSTVGLIVRQSQTTTGTDIQQWQQGDGFVWGRVTAQGEFQFGANGSTARFGLTTSVGVTTLAVATPAATYTGLTIRGFTNQSADYLQIQNSSSSIVSSITSGGIFNANSSQYGNTLTWSAPASTTYYLLATLPTSSAGTLDHIQIDGIHGGWGSSDFSKSTFIFANRNAFTWRHFLSNRDITANFKLRAYSQVDGSVQIWASGEASQFLKFAYNISSAQNIITSQNPTAAFVAPSGTVVFDSSNTTTYPPVETKYGGLNIINTTSGTVPFIVRGASGQSVNLQEWQTNTPTTIASLSSTGVFTTTGLTLTSNTSPITLNGSMGTVGQVLTSVGANQTPTWSSGPSAATTSTAHTGYGYTGIPQNATTTGSYTVAASDAGKHIYASATRTVTIDSNTNLALPIGTTLTFIAGVGATMTIAITTDTMYLAGAGTTGSRTLAAHGIATAVKTTATTWLISGNGLT